MNEEIPVIFKKTKTTGINKSKLKVHGTFSKQLK